MLDGQMLPIDTIQMNGDIEMDFHHISQCENGNLILLGKELKTVDLSGTIWGGSPYATVIGAVIQEFDQEKKLLYEWKSLDHIDIGDTISCLVDPKALSIDYIHVNSVQADTDSTWIISCRNLDQVIKIHKERGEILWRLGGVGNQFVFTNDSLRFSAQHSVHLHSNGILSLFDNGNCKAEKISRSLVYSLNQEERTITLSGELSHTPPVFSVAMGNYILLGGGQSLTCWGKNNRKIIFTRYQGEAVLNEITTKKEYPFYSYAVHPVEWSSPIEITNDEPFSPGEVMIGDSLVLEIEFHNTMIKEVCEAGFHFEGAKVLYQDTSLLSLSPGETRVMKVLCIPERTGQLKGQLTAYFRYGAEPYAPIAGSQIGLILDVSSPSSKMQQYSRNASFQLFPNPAGPVLTIEIQESVEKLGIYSISGVLQKQLDPSGNDRHEYSIAELADGSYFIIGTCQSGKIIRGRFIKHD